MPLRGVSGNHRGGEARRPEKKKGELARGSARARADGAVAPVAHGILLLLLLRFLRCSGRRFRREARVVAAGECRKRRENDQRPAHSAQPLQTAFPVFPAAYSGPTLPFDSMITRSPFRRL